MPKIGIATGCYRNLCKMNDSIDRIYQLEADCIELTLGPQNVRPLVTQLSYDDATLKRLEDFSQVSIHAPNIPYPDNGDTTEVTSALQELCDGVNGRYMLVHPATKSTICINSS